MQPTTHLGWIGGLALAVVTALSSVPARGESNAARPAMGARISATPGSGAQFDPASSADELIDGNVHSRMVVTGAPYTINLELFQPVLVDRVAISASDYESETAAKDVEVTLDDGTVLKQTLEQTFSVKRKPAWQEMKIGKKTKTIRIAVLSVYDNKNKWGGIGEIAAYTSEDLESRLVVPNYDAKAPSFVNLPSVRADAQPVPVKMPPQAKDGVYPRTMLTPEELVDLKAKVMASPEGKEAYRFLISLGDSLLKEEIKFPDPKGPLGQLKDRNDAVAKAHDKLAQDCGNLARAYAFSGEKKYAEKSAEILKGYAERYESYPDHKGVNGSDTGKVMAQRLSECMWLIPQLMAYDLIHDSGVLTPEDHKLIENGLIRPAITFVWLKSPAAQAADNTRKNPDWRTTTPPAPAKRTPVGNWLNFYNSATMLAGAVLNDRDMIDIAAANFRVLIRNGIGEDGMWGEGAVGYQYFALAGMMPGIETGARHGVNLWSFDDNRLKLMFDTPKLYAYPDGSMPGINDSGRVPGSGWTMIVCDYAYARYGDIRYASAINDTPRQLQFTTGIFAPTIIFEKLQAPAAPKYPSAVFNGLGYSILRNDNIYSLVDYGPHGGPHGHFDKLNLILYGNGDELGGEPGFHRYEDSLHNEWTKVSLAHNTMSVDERTQMASEGKLLSYEATPAVKVMRAEAASAVPGAVLDRTVVLTGDSVIDIYSARSAFDRTFDRTLRFKGKLDQLKAAGDKPLGERDGYQHFKVAERAPANDGWTGAWTTEKGAFTVSVAAKADQEIILGNGPDKDEIALLRQHGQRADVGVVYQTGKSAIQSVKIVDSGSPDVVAMKIDNADQSTTLVLVSHKAGAWKALDVESDAQVVYLRRGADGAAECIFTGGTNAHSAGVDMKLDAAGNAYGQTEGGQFKQSFSWSPAK